MECHILAFWLVKKEIQAELGRAALKSNAAEATYTVFATTDMWDNLPHPPMAQPEPLGAHAWLEEAVAKVENTLRASYISAAIRHTMAKFKFLTAANTFILIYRH